MGSKLNEAVKKCNFVLLALCIWGLTILYNGVLVEPLSDLFLFISNPSWFGLIVHILICLLIICAPTVIALKYLDLSIKRLLLSFPIMYLLFAVYAPPTLYLFVYTGEWSFWQHFHPAMPAWKASLFITLQYGVVILVARLIIWLRSVLK